MNARWEVRASQKGQVPSIGESGLRNLPSLVFSTGATEDTALRCTYRGVSTGPKLKNMLRKSSRIAYFWHLSATLCRSAAMRSEADTQAALFAAGLLWSHLCS